MPISFPKCSGGSSNIPEAGSKQSSSKQSIGPFSSVRNLFVTLPIYNTSLFLFGTSNIAAYQAAFRSLSGNGEDIEFQQFCKYGLNSAWNTGNDCNSILLIRHFWATRRFWFFLFFLCNFFFTFRFTFWNIFSETWLFYFSIFFLLSLLRHTQSETSYQTYNVAMRVNIPAFNFWSTGSFIVQSFKTLFLLLEHEM